MAASDTSCGLLGWRPAFLQRLALPWSYLAIYFTVGAVQSAIYSYLTVILSTLERLFGLRSAETAWLLSGNEVSQVVVATAFLPLVGRVKKRPLWLAVSTAVCAVGLFIMAMPHLKNTNDPVVAKSTGAIDEKLCSNKTRIEAAFPINDDENINDYGSFAALFFGVFLYGIGVSFFYAFGVPYADDNASVKPMENRSPLALAIILSSRTAGPSLGYLLASLCLSTYVNPSASTGIDGGPLPLGEDDPRWLGAWWIGFVLVGLVLLALTPVIALFPERLPGSTQGGALGDCNDNKIYEAKDERSNDHKVTNGVAGEAKRPDRRGFAVVKEYLHEGWTVSVRLFTNGVWVCNLASTVAALFGFVGFGTFAPKYFEYHFRKRASTAGSAPGLTKAVAAVVGMLFSGWIVGK